MGNKYFVGGGAIVLGLLLASSGIAMAATGTMPLNRRFTPPAAVGTVASISGGSISLTGKNGTTYTVDATNAKLEKIAAPSATDKRPKPTTIAVGDIAVGDTLSVQGTVSGDNITATQILDGMGFGGELGGHGGPGMKMGTPPAAVGTVSAISGDTITLNDTMKSITYSVDATNAKINKFAALVSGQKPTSTTISIADIMVGDNIVVQGTVSGTNITATQITDGKFMGGMGGPAGMMMRGKPAAIGSVTGISGNIITINNSKANQTYTVDATNAKINKFTPGASGQKPASTPISVSGIAVGDQLMVQGTATGNNITATQITDGMPEWGGMGGHRGNWGPHATPTPTATPTP